jgi:hypothetical protein
LKGRFYKAIKTEMMLQRGQALIRSQAQLVRALSTTAAPAAASTPAKPPTPPTATAAPAAGTTKPQEPVLAKVCCFCNYL